MVDVTLLPLYEAKNTIINQYTIEQENNLFSPATERAYKDKITQVFVKRNELLDALKSARQNIWVTVDFNDDATLKIVDQDAFKSYRTTISGLITSIAKYDKVITALDAMGATSYDDVKKLVDINSQKFHSQTFKLATLEQSTRTDADSLKRLVKEAKEELSETESILKHNQDILQKVNKILIEVGL